VPHDTVKTIYIQPLGSFASKRSPDLRRAVDFARVFFFGLDVQLLQPVEFESIHPRITHRVNEYTSKRQYHSEGILAWLNSANTKRACGRNVRKELVCIAVTMEDLYPREEWNFVYGIARIGDGVGVWSFARLDPLFFELDDNQLASLEPSQEERILINRRGIKILVHELTHLFGLKHCIYFTCLMNGANHEEEMVRQPFWLCPICLRKLHSSLKFPVLQRYMALLEQFRLLSFEPEVRWAERAIQHIRQTLPQPATSHSLTRD